MSNRNRLRRWRTARIAVGCWVSLASSGAAGQSAPTLVGVGTSLSIPGNWARIAPGDVVALQVVGLKTVLPAPVKATSLPLPTALAGISVLMSDSNIPPGRPGEPREAVSLFSIEQTALCGSRPPACTITSIVIHVPRRAYRGTYPYVSVVIAENGVESEAFVIYVDPVDIHVLRTCLPDAGGGCADHVPAVTHADGTLVTAASPATPGEAIVIYATGLGSTNPPVAPGHATPAPAPTTESRFYLQLDFSPNARPRRPDRSPLIPPFAPAPEFVGLTPGQVGLYQINVRIPGTIAPVPPCRVDALTGVNVLSNLTISFGVWGAGNNDLDGAAICIASPQ